MLARLLARAQATGTLDAAAVSRGAGAVLTETGRSNRAFIFYEAAGVRSGGHSLAVDLRVPRPGGGATAGPLLALEVAGPCLSRAGLEARFGRLAPTQVPHGHSLDEKAYWSRDEKWGELSFGFSERNPECLASVVFKVAAR